MSYSYAKTQLLGNVGNDPKIHEFDDGNKIMSFSVGTSNKWKNSDGETVEKTHWHRIVIKDQNKIKYAKKAIQKGVLVLIDGSLENRTYSKDGTDIQITEIVIAPYGGDIRTFSKPE